MIKLILILWSLKGHCYGNLLFFLGGRLFTVKNLVNFDPVTPEFMRVECAIFASTRNDSTSFSTLAFQNGLEYRNFDFSILIGNHFSTLCRNLVRFGSVTESLQHKNMYSSR